jgi:hypothetical protein
MMASENDQLFLGHAQIVKPLMKSEKFYFSKGSNLDNLAIITQFTSSSISCFETSFYKHPPYFVKMYL